LLRVGMGHDVHKLASGRRLVVGGVEIAHTRGAVSHSDGDVLVHAIIDAILGACSLGDIGTHFPDDDLQYKGISSMELLKRTLDMVTGTATVENIDSTVVAEEPKLARYIGTMREGIAGVVGIPKDRVSIKAKTAEGLGPVGKGEAIEAHAVALVRLDR
jgi:2-C-methyl-D-erythritol 2,4-cyclodiphosphate synthase